MCGYEAMRTFISRRACVGPRCLTSCSSLHDIAPRARQGTRAGDTCAAGLTVTVRGKGHALRAWQILTSCM